jgi:hypothetical protein
MTTERKPRATKPKALATYRILQLFGMQSEIESSLNRLSAEGWTITATRIEPAGFNLSTPLYHFFGLARKP